MRDVLAQAALLLCGGVSRRMGRDKATLPFGPELMAARVRRRLLEVVPEVWLVAREGQSLPCDGPVIRDPAEGGGPLVAVAAGLAAVPARHVVVVACDLPLVNPAVVQRLFALAAGADVEACVPWCDGQPVPDCAVYDVAAAREAAARLVTAGERRLRALPAALRTRAVPPHELADLDPTLESLRDCDTPARYGEALRRAGYRSPGGS